MYYDLGQYYNLGAAPAGYFQNPTDIDAGGPLGYPQRCFGTSGRFIDFDDQNANLRPLSEILNTITNQSEHFRQLSQSEIDDISNKLQNMEARFRKLINGYIGVKNIFAQALNAAQSGQSASFDKKFLEGIKALQQIGNQKFVIFKEVDALMLKAQSHEALRQICSAKFNLVQSLDKLTREAGRLGQAGLKIEKDNISVLNSFVDDVVVRSENVLRILNDIYKDAASAASFFTKHKWLMYSGAGILGLAGIAFAFRPYFKVLFGRA